MFVPTFVITILFGMAAAAMFLVMAFLILANGMGAATAPDQVDFRPVRKAFFLCMVFLALAVWSLFW